MHIYVNNYRSFRIVILIFELDLMVLQFIYKKKKYYYYGCHFYFPNPSGSGVPSGRQN